MDDKLLKIIKKILNNYEYDADRHISIYSSEILSEKDKRYLDDSGFEINQPVLYTHDEIVDNLLKLSKSENFSMERMVKSFVASMKSYARGNMTIFSYLYATKLHKHKINSREYKDKLCLYCGAVPKSWGNKVIVLYNLYTGRNWNDIFGYYVDLEEFRTLEPVEPTIEDWDIFSQLIELIDSADEKESVSKLEKRIISEKLFKGGKGRIRGILFVLSMLGVMPSKTLKPIYDGFITQEDLFNSPQVGSHRSDIEPPLNGWKGNLGIDRVRLSEIFDEYR